MVLLSSSSFCFLLPPPSPHFLPLPPSLHPVGPTISNLTYSEEARTLTCVSTGSPATVVSWLKDGSLLPTHSSFYHFTQTVTGRASSTYSNVLNISREDTNFIGSYTCNVSNALGSNSSTLTVLGEWSPKLWVVSCDEDNRVGSCDVLGSHVMSCNKQSWLCAESGRMMKEVDHMIFFSLHMQGWL